MINSQVMAYIRTTKEGFRSQTCDIYQPSWTADDFGAQQKSFVQVGSEVTCRVITGQKSYTSGTMKQGELKVMKDELRVSLPVGTALDVDYEIEVESIRYQVVRLIDDLTDDTQVQAVITRRR